MKQVKKALVDELLSWRREYWERVEAGVKDKKRLKITALAMAAERKINEEAGQEFLDFDNLARSIKRVNRELVFLDSRGRGNAHGEFGGEVC